VNASNDATGAWSPVHDLGAQLSTTSIVVCREPRIAFRYRPRFLVPDRSSIRRCERHMEDHAVIEVSGAVAIIGP
jgi:hypothetical protein